MGAQFDSEYVYIYDQNNTPYFVQYHYGAAMDDSYRSDIYLKDKSYCVLDLFLTDEVETEGEFLPYVKEKEWRDFLTTGPSEGVSTILAEAGLADISVSKLVFIHMLSSSRLMLEYDGFVSSAEGVKDLDLDFLEQAFSFARAKTASVAEQEELAANWIAEQIQNCKVTG
jgi:hypothetical protein